MTISASGNNRQARGESHETQLYQRFRTAGARALIEECGRLSESIASISKRLADVEKTAGLILSLLDFPLPMQGTLQRPLMKRVGVTAKMFCNSADGFHDLEHTQDGTAFRWTGPRPEFRFLVHIDRQQACLAELILISNKYLSEGAQIACYVDRNWVPSQLLPVDGKIVRLSFTLPKLEVNRATELVFMAPSVIVPKDVIPGSQDARSLGVQFVELRVGVGDGLEGGVSDAERSAD